MANTITVPGTIICITTRGLDFPTSVIVVYEWKGRAYRLEEALKVKRETIRLGPIPIGQRTVPVLGKLKEGMTLNVSLDPQNPGNAFLTDNVGFGNI